MFEVGFSELCMVGLVTLLVVGPERLPKIARTVGFWLGKTRRIIENAKTEIQSELQAEEIRQLLRENASLQHDVTDKLDALKIQFNSTLNDSSQPEKTENALSITVKNNSE